MLSGKNQLRCIGLSRRVTFEVIADIFMRNTAAVTVERLGRLASEANVRMQWVGVPAFKYQANIRPELEALHERFKEEGRDFWTGFHHVSPTSMMNFISSLVFSQNGNPVWQEMVNAKGEETKLLTIEEAVHVLTGKVADFLGLAERGVLKVGYVADLTVFDLSEIERRPEEKVWDVPDGDGGVTYRYTRAPAPMRLTLVNGVATFDNGAVTGRFPGQFIGPGAAAEQATKAE